VKLLIQASAEADVVRQFEWYVESGRPDIAVRFMGAVREAINALAAMPGAGAPKYMTNAQLAGLRAWPVKRFDEFMVYDLAENEAVTVLRILHGKRDIGSILADQGLEGPHLH
jgi:plasmid stabilization system protein ParE